MDKGQLATEDELYNIICRHTRHEEGYGNIPWSYPPIFFPPISHGENLFLFGSTIFFESKEITLTAHEVAAGMVMGRSLGTNAMHLGTYVLSQDPRKKRTKIMSPWVSVISFSPFDPSDIFVYLIVLKVCPPCAYLSIFCHILFFCYRSKWWQGPWTATLSRALLSFAIQTMKW